MLMLSLELGDRLVLTDEHTGAVTSIEFDDIRGTRRDGMPGKARLCIKAPKHIRITRELLDQRIQRERGVAVRQTPPPEGGAA